MWGGFLPQPSKRICELPFSFLKKEVAISSGFFFVAWGLKLRPCMAAKGPHRVAPPVYLLSVQAGLSLGSSCFSLGSC